MQLALSSMMIMPQVAEQCIHGGISDIDHRFEEDQLVRREELQQLGDDSVRKGKRAALRLDADKLQNHIP